MSKMELGMKKVHSVTKTIGLILVLFSTIHNYSQEYISGKYSNLKLNQEHYNYYSFTESGFFEYHSGASLGDDTFGKGSYHIKNDSLFLNYDSTELEYHSYYKLKEYRNSGDSIQLKVVVKDFHEKIIKNTNVYIAKDRIGAVVTKDEAIVLKLKKEDKKFVLGISNIGFESLKITLSQGINYEIEAYLKQSSSPTIAIKDQIEKYQILEHTDRYLILKDKNSSVKYMKVD